MKIHIRTQYPVISDILKKILAMKMHRIFILSITLGMHLPGTAQDRDPDSVKGAPQLTQSHLSGPDKQNNTRNNTRMEGYRGIWFTLGQVYKYGDKYSGGLGTYTAKHRPMAIYAPGVDKTFFVYGGTTAADEKNLLCMIAYYDHATGTVPRPVIVHEKKNVDDPHDNPSLLIDREGYLWVFVSGRSTRRMGFKYRSHRPYAIDSFMHVSTGELTYPQPWLMADGSFFHFFTKYSGRRELYFESSHDGFHWSETGKLAGIREPGDKNAGHYQVSAARGMRAGTFFSRHPNGNVDKRTNLYYLQTKDMGDHWTNASGQEVPVPLTRPDNPALVINYQERNRNVYLKDMDFDSRGNPCCLYLTSGGHEPGPVSEPYQWKLTRWTGTTWKTHDICTSDHNYDMGSLYLNDTAWIVVAPVTTGPQPYATGGEIAIWISRDQGHNWVPHRQITSSSRNNHTYIRRPEQARDPFRFFWADGDPGNMSHSYLYFGNMEGAVWRLPYTMSGAHEKPARIYFNHTEQ